MSNWKKAKGYADGGEIENEVEEAPQGRFSADVYERARKFVESGGKGPQKARRAAPKPQRPTDTGDETKRLEARKAAPRGLTNDDDPSIPKAEYDATEKPRSRVSRFVDEAKDNVGKALAVAGPTAGAIGLAAKARRGYQAAKQADDVMAAANARARAARKAVDDARYFEGGMKDGGMVRDYGKK